MGAGLEVLSPTCSWTPRRCTPSVSCLVAVLAFNTSIWAAKAQDKELQQGLEGDAQRWQQLLLRGTRGRELQAPAGPIFSAAEKGDEILIRPSHEFCGAGIEGLGSLLHLHLHPSHTPPSADPAQSIAGSGFPQGFKPPDLLSFLARGLLHL